MERANITLFEVIGLHRSKDITIPIEDDKLVFVGVNGLGKTTIVNLLFFLLSRQWSRLTEYEFESLSVVAKGERITIRREQIVAWASFARLESALPPGMYETLSTHADWWHFLNKGQITPDLRLIIQDLGLPLAFLRDAIRRESRETEDQVHLQREIEAPLKRIITGQILYLPTYRRIERDLKAIFPGLDRQINELLERRQRRHTDSHVELVEFGMRDIERRLTDAFQAIKETARHELNKLAASYLREVIRDEARTYDEQMIASLTDRDIDAILNRIQEQTFLDFRDKARLREVIGELKSSGSASEHHKYIGHFFGKLANIHRNISLKESAVSNLVAVCNGYLVEKKLVFDDKKYEVSCELERGGRMQFSMLSSGEKQIVSLFTHLYLGDRDMIFLIDEPELSLSVDWQKKLLPDIVRSQRCSFVLAATHSPFVFQNDEFDLHTVDLKDCIKEHS